MKFEEYFEQTSATAVYKPEFASGYCYLGLLGEMAEFNDLMHRLNGELFVDDAIKELGDITWYIVEECKSFNMLSEYAAKCFESGELAYVISRTNDTMLLNIMRFANTLKRRYKLVDKGTHDLKSEEDFIITCWNMVFGYLSRINYVFNSDYTIEQVFEQNILKLRDRYNETKTEGLAN